MTLLTKPRAALAALLCLPQLAAALGDPANDYLDVVVNPHANRSGTHTARLATRSPVRVAQFAFPAFARIALTFPRVARRCRFAM